MWIMFVLGALILLGMPTRKLLNDVTGALYIMVSYGTPTELEVEFAKITELLPSIEKFRLVSSGTETVMSAIRLARGYTNKKYIIKFNGCYHGHSDCLLIKAGSGLQTLVIQVVPEYLKKRYVIH